eukprot:5788548-Pleurochrysis_carterae.AAC.1
MEVRILHFVSLLRRGLNLSKTHGVGGRAPRQLTGTGATAHADALSDFDAAAVAGGIVPVVSTPLPMQMPIPMLFRQPAECARVLLFVALCRRGGHLSRPSRRQRRRPSQQSSENRSSLGTLHSSPRVRSADAQPEPRSRFT